MGVLERDCQGNYICVDRNRTAKQPESIGVELQKRLDQDRAIPAFRLFYMIFCNMTLLKENIQRKFKPKMHIVICKYILFIDYSN